jgi:HK97 family phage major capsid protein
MPPTNVEELAAKATVLIEDVRALAAKAEADGREFTPDERAAVKSKLDEAKALKDARDEALGDSELRKAIGDIGRGLVDSPGAHLATAGRKSAGERFTADPDFAAWLKTKAPSGEMSHKGSVGQSPPVIFRGLKDILSGGDAAGAGALVFPDFRGLLDATGTLQRPLTIRNLVTAGTTTSDSVSYARVVGSTNNAAPVAEASGTSAGDATADVTGEKPESALELEQVNETVKTVAHWLPATKRALSDAAQIRTLIDNFLRYGLEEELEDQMVNGNGSGENFEGILTVSGVQTCDATDVSTVDPAAAGTLAGIVGLRVAKRLVRVNGRATPTAYVLNPADNERIDLGRDGNDNFYFGGPGGNGVSTAWGLPRIESEAVAPGTAICADWRWAVLWDREQASISVSDSHADFFVRNLVAILAELRAAFGVLRPAAFCEIDLTAIFAIS